jgi:hypothetical protein
VNAQPNKSVETNRRPAFPLNAGRQFESTLCAPSFLSAAVAHLCRWTHMKYHSSLLAFCLLSRILVAAPEPEQTRVNFQYFPAPDSLVLEGYAGIAGLTLIKDLGVIRGTPIRVRSDEAVTKQEAKKLIDNALLEQAGIMILPLDSQRAFVTRKNEEWMQFLQNRAALPGVSSLQRDYAKDSVELWLPPLLEQPKLSKQAFFSMMEAGSRAEPILIRKMKKSYDRPATLEDGIDPARRCAILMGFVEPISKDGAEALITALDDEMNIALAAAQSIEMLADRSTAQLSVFAQAVPKLHEKSKISPNFERTARAIEAKLKGSRERQ